MRSTATMATYPVSYPQISIAQEHLKVEVNRASGMEKQGYWRIKRMFDVLCSALALVVLSPVMLIVALAIYIDDPHGSPIYSQERVGRHQKLFKFYKFRTMVVGADSMVKDLQKQNEKDGPVFKIKDDPRITRIGHFLRKTSLDELPQLVNILRGDMSIVGPRPPLPREVAQYTEYQKLRLTITPGLTCYWQCTPNRDAISFNDWVAMDIQYIKDRNIPLDLKLILRTVKCCFTGQGE